MKTILAIRHVYFENLGILESELQQQGYRIQYLDATTTSFSQFSALAYDLVIVLGAPIGAFSEDKYPFLAQELSFIEKRLSTDKPLLGICLGAQLIARALGASVHPMPMPEIGYSALTLTEAGQDTALAALGHAPVLHWHGDQFDIPAGATRLASTGPCPNQAFSAGKAALGLQFHLEADPQKIEQWLVGHAHELAQSHIDLAKLRSDAQKYGATLAQRSLTVFRIWQHEAGLV